MKFLSLSILFMICHILPAGSLAKPVIDDHSGKDICYIYISVNKDRKIVIFRLDPEKGELIRTGEQSLAGEPGSLCANPSNRNLYAALRDLNCVSNLKIDKHSGILSYQENTPVAGNPVYISTDKKGRYLLFASYSENKIAVYSFGNNRLNKDPVQVMDARINPHMIKTDPAGRFVFVPNKGGDIVQQFILKKNGIMLPNDPEGIRVRITSGPRHFIFHPLMDIMYVVNELSCTVTGFNFDPKRGILSGPFQEITTKPPHYTLYNTCADIHITPDGKFLYASNRGHDSLAGFKVNELSGELTSIGWFPTEKEPREFEIDPSGRFIIAAGESSGKIALYKIQDDGLLSLLKQYKVGKWPVWVLALVLR